MYGSGAGTDGVTLHHQGGKNPVGATSGPFRVFPGGSWRDSMSSCECACRVNYVPHGGSDNYLGLRLVCRS